MYLFLIKNNILVILLWKAEILLTNIFFDQDQSISQSDYKLVLEDYDIASENTILHGNIAMLYERAHDVGTN